MGQVLHGSARTTEAVRRAIQRREESVRALARRHGISPTTVQKWRKRTSVGDARIGPKAIHSTVLTGEEEAMIVAFRGHNLGSHKGTAVRNAIRAVGARLIFLPPYSPDLNPIEQMSRCKVPRT